MEVLGHEIDVDFIYKINPVVWNNFHRRLFFELSFKDGKTHLVEFCKNYALLEAKDKKGKSFEATLKKDTAEINKLRDEIISEKNKLTK